VEPGLVVFGVPLGDVEPGVVVVPLGEVDPGAVVFGVPFGEVDPGVVESGMPPGVEPGVALGEVDPGVVEPGVPLGDVDPGVVALGDVPFGEVEPGVVWVVPAGGVAVPAGGVALPGVELCPAEPPAGAALPPEEELCAATHAALQRIRKQSVSFLVDLIVTSESFYLLDSATDIMLLPVRAKIDYVETKVWGLSSVFRTLPGNYPGQGLPRRENQGSSLRQRRT
jgi:hypothetical protein